MLDNQIHFVLSVRGLASVRVGDAMVLYALLAGFRARYSVGKETEVSGC